MTRQTDYFFYLLRFLVGAGTFKDFMGFSAGLSLLLYPAAAWPSDVQDSVIEKLSLEELSALIAIW